MAWKNNGITLCMIVAYAIVGLSACSAPSKPNQTKAADLHYLTVSAAFSSYDNNGDGFLDRHEFSQLQQDPQIAAMRNSIPELRGTPLLYEEIDENEDERITLEELTIISQPLIPKR